MIAIKQKVNKEELAKLAGNLSAIKTFIEIERRIDGKESYKSISKVFEGIVVESGEIADRILFAGIKDGKEPSKTFECICGTTFKEEDGEHKNGYLVCPSCWNDDIREVTINATEVF